VGHIVKARIHDCLLVHPETTFDALYSHFAGRWQQQDDVVHPFSDRRCVDDRRVQIGTVWTFNLDSDILFMHKEGHYGQIVLELVRQSSITASDFTSYHPPLRLDSTTSSAFPPPYWEPKRQGLDLSLFKQREAFLARILSDFAFQWRHVLRGPFNGSTFRRLAYAILRIVILDFTVVEINTPRRGTGGFLVRLQDLPRWNPWNEDIIRIGGASIVICQHVVHATSLIRADFKKWTIDNLKQDPIRKPDVFRTYLILSVHEVLLYQINSDIERYTKSECLFDNTGAFSPKAVDLLLKSTQHRIPTTYIDTLPCELQNLILDEIAVGPLERAKIGCNLQIGPAFQWKYDDRSIEREEGCKNRIAETLVESQIWFDDCFSGVAYK
jgi:hypothetical protein